MSNSRPNAVLRHQPLQSPWPTLDPFLFCAHHLDDYPAANSAFGPASGLEGRNPGQDFSGAHGWSMYHGADVPGFPAHPHRGFETVTLVRSGWIDHSDSLGAAARFGSGDVQWLTAGRGIVHSEMFPLLDRTKGNPLELFQIWLNLPAASKFVEPHFSMMWADTIPELNVQDEGGHAVRVRCIAGRLGDVRPPAPPPDSWAARQDADVAIWTISLSPHATWTLPPASGAQTRRMLYFFQGDALRLDDEGFTDHRAIEIDATRSIALSAGDSPTELVLLQGRPIGEKVAQYGPFVMNTPDEIRQAIHEYQATQFGEWSWPEGEAPVHGAQPERFARYPDGSTERS